MFETGSEKLLALLDEEETFWPYAEQGATMRSRWPDDISFRP